MAGAFKGFTPQTIQFYRGLSQHNDQTWFEAHREDYLKYAMEPAQSLVLDLGPQLQKLRSGFQFNPDFNGKGSIKKIHADRRFNRDREPYKTWLGVFFWEGPLKTKKDNSVVSLRISPNELRLFAGFKHFEPSVQKAYRAAVADEASGQALEQITVKLAQQGYTIDGAAGFAKVPHGFPADHPRADLLKHDALVAFHSEPLSDVVFSPKLADYALKHFKAMLPLHAWCVDALARIS